MSRDDSNPKDRLGVKKVPLRLFPNVARIYGALAFAEGERKYGAFNWRNKKVRYSVYIEAMDRHLSALNAGEDIDPDSGLPHEAKILACAAILLDARRADCLIDDRFEKDGSAELLREFTAQDYATAAKTLTRTPARTLDEVRAEVARGARRRAPPASKGKRRRA